MSTLPGMPMRYGDPGMFVCGPEDIQPWLREPARARRPSATVAARAPLGVWLVLSRCARCARIRAYCSDHRLDWLFNDRARTYRPRSRLLRDQQSPALSDSHVPDDCA